MAGRVGEEVGAVADRARRLTLSLVHGDYAPAFDPAVHEDDDYGDPASDDDGEIEEEEDDEVPTETTPLTRTSSRHKSRSRAGSRGQLENGSEYVLAEDKAWKDDIVTFDSDDDPANPKNWSYTRKVSYTILYGLTTMCSTIASGIYAPATKSIAAEFGVHVDVAQLGTGLFVLGFVAGPLAAGPLSEVYGRKTSVIPPMYAFTFFTFLAATAKDIRMLLLARCLSGLFSSAPITTAGGSLADMFEQKERAVATVLYAIAVLIGPTIGPIMGALIVRDLGWRWTQYITIIISLTIVTLNAVVAEETFVPVILTEKARRLRLKTGRWELHSRHEMQDLHFSTFLRKNLIRPMHMLATEPILLFVTIFNAFTYGILYGLLGALPIIYQENRGWDPVKGSLPFLAELLGILISAGINIWYSHSIFSKYVEKAGGKVPPELRLKTMLYGSIVFPIGFFLLGYTSDPSTTWVWSALGLTCIGVGFLLIFQAGLNYVIDVFTEYSASAVAAMTFLRSIAAAVTPVAARPLFHSIGIKWACTLLGVLAIAQIAVPVIFYVYGARIRARSPLARHA